VRYASRNALSATVAGSGTVYPLNTGDPEVTVTLVRVSSVSSPLCNASTPGRRAKAGVLQLIRVWRSRSAR
jgi:hypothetical protein